VQTGKIKKVPVILFGTSFWNPLVTFIRETLVHEWKTVSDTDMELFVVTDSIDEVVEIARKTPNKKGAISDN
jgi:predicted Rossmann-fold nucleotide-binding protein